MKSPVVFRAVFTQPIGPLNPSRYRMPGHVPVEVFQERIGPPAEWRVRNPANGRVFNKITPQSNPETLNNQMLFYFEKQVGDWIAYHKDGSLYSELTRADWYVDDKGRAILTDAYKEKIKELKAVQNTVTK